MKIVINNKIPVRALPEFRFWHVGRQKMYIVDCFDRENNLICWPGDNATLDEWDEVNADQMDVADGVLMQFTGMIDSKGAKIWEGDILYTTYPGDVIKEDVMHSYGYVAFMYGGFGIIPSPTHEEIDSFLSNLDSINPERNSERVIGNVHQHGHLLFRDYWYNRETNVCGFPPDDLNYDPESIYTFCSKLSIGTIDEHSDVSPFGKYPDCSSESQTLLKTPTTTQYR